MLKQQWKLEITKNDRVYQLLLSDTSPLGECFDVITDFRTFIYEKIKEAEAAAQQAKKADEEASKE